MQGGGNNMARYIQHCPRIAEKIYPQARTEESYQLQRGLLFQLLRERAWVPQRASCPRIGASFSELGRSASELRTWQNEYLQGQVARKKEGFDFTSEQYPHNVNITPEELERAGRPYNNLLEKMDEAYARTREAVVKKPARKTPCPLFNMLDARAKAEKKKTTSKSKSRNKK